MIDANFLALLCCPATHLPLRQATVEELARAGLDDGLAREDGRLVYPTRDGIPVLLVEEGVAIGEK